MEIGLCLLNTIALPHLHPHSLMVVLANETQVLDLILNIGNYIFSIPHQCQFRMVVQGLGGVTSWACPIFLLLFLRLLTVPIHSAFCRALVQPQFLGLIGEDTLRAHVFPLRTTAAIRAGAAQSCVRTHTFTFGGAAVCDS